MAGRDVTTRFLLANNWQNELKQGRGSRDSWRREKVIRKEIDFIPLLKAKHQFMSFLTEDQQNIKPVREIFQVCPRTPCK